jgi:hypothetical protein
MNSKIQGGNLELPSNLFNGAFVENVIVGENGALKLPEDASLFNGLNAQSILFWDFDREFLPESLFANVTGLERLQISIPFKSIPAKLFDGLGDSLQSL